MSNIDKQQKQKVSSKANIVNKKQKKCQQETVETQSNV